MTYRDRREARVERLNEWADKRETKAVADLNSYPEMRHDWAFITQPGRIVARDRMNASDERAFRSMNKAEEMRSKAANISAAVDRSIYSDDPDAVDALKARIASLEAERDRIKAFNATCRKGSPDWSLLTEAERKDLLRTAEACAWQVTDSKGNFRGYPSYHLTNLSGNIKRNKDRLIVVERDQARALRSEMAGGLLIEQLAGGYCSVTFSEKPAREILDALRGAGFQWRRGSWWGKADAVPSAVSA